MLLTGFDLPVDPAMIEWGGGGDLRAEGGCRTVAFLAAPIRRRAVSRRAETHLLERLFLRPVGAGMNFAGRLFARMHHGRLNAYVGYVVAFLIIVLLLFRLT